LHDRHFRFAAPEPVLAVPEWKQDPDTWLAGPTPEDSDLLQVPDVGAFVRALLPIRLEQGHTLTYGIWLAVRPAEFHAVVSAWWAPEYSGLKFSGSLANAVAPWGLLGVPVEAVVRDIQQAPYCERSSDPQLHSILHDEWPHDLVLSGLVTSLPLNSEPPHGLSALSTDRAPLESKSCWWRTIGGR
jgi:hypothetical protein